MPISVDILLMLYLLFEEVSMREHFDRVLFSDSINLEKHIEEFSIFQRPIKI